VNLNITDYKGKYRCQYILVVTKDVIKVMRRNNKAGKKSDSNVSREGLAPIVKAYSRLILVDGLVL
jgi:hypothetical protein